MVLRVPSRIFRLLGIFYIATGFYVRTRPDIRLKLSQLKTVDRLALELPIGYTFRIDVLVL